MVKKAAKKTVKKTVAKKSAKKVDFEPNKMTFAVASLSAVTLVLLAIIAMYS
ncbi:MAG TPA: hypothetical protein VFZ62_02570 [Candidatus Saccharimonadales bacterium]